MSSFVYPERLYTKQSLPFSIGGLAPPLGALPCGGVCAHAIQARGALVRLGTERTSSTDSRLHGTGRGREERRRRNGDAKDGWQQERSALLARQGIGRARERRVVGLSQALLMT